MAKNRKTRKPEISSLTLDVARWELRDHPLFRYLMDEIEIVSGTLCPRSGWALVSPGGTISINPKGHTKPKEWIYAIAHCLLHLGFGHFKMRENKVLWNAACDCFVMRFLRFLKVGRLPLTDKEIDLLPAGSEEAIYRFFVSSGIPYDLQFLLKKGPGFQDMISDSAIGTAWKRPLDWQSLFASGIASAVSSILDQEGNKRRNSRGEEARLSRAEQARRWFIANYPLLGALAAGVTLIEDGLLCSRLGIRVAAVNAQLQEVYIHQVKSFSQEEIRFVIAHELLHLGLSHHARCQGRNPFLWNVACDYVINGWLIEMKIGLPPKNLLFDPSLQGLSAESIYDRIVTDIRGHRKSCTFRGIGAGDILDDSQPGWWQSGKGLDLDAFYKRSLAQGLEYHERSGREFLPAGLIEEIRALGQPPIAWDVALAKWFDDCFPPVEKHRSYSRPSRHQASTPDIPRPSWVLPAGAHEGRTFGVILDTSGSMDRTLLAKALGVIASYCMSRDVSLVRVVFCDATYYDQGYMSPEEIAGIVSVRGRGGTILQPAIDFLDKDRNFPPDGPLLIITDGSCDRLRILRKHAFIVPQGRYLPFEPKGKVFHID